MSKKISVYLAVIFVISGLIVGAVASAMWPQFSVPFLVSDPIEIMDYPTDLTLFPGETIVVNIVVNNSFLKDGSVIPWNLLSMMRGEVIAMGIPGG